MNIEEKVVLEFSKEDVIEVLSDYARSKGYDVSSVTLTIGEVTKGQGMSEHIEKEFKGAKVVCHKG